VSEAKVMILGSLLYQQCDHSKIPNLNIVRNALEGCACPNLLIWKGTGKSLHNLSIASCKEVRNSVVNQVSLLAQPITHLLVEHSCGLSLYFNTIIFF
jgi:hypothetical protein